MKLIELIKKHSWKEIEPVFLRLFPIQGNHAGFYRKMFEELQHLVPVDGDISVEFFALHECIYLKTVVDSSECDMNEEIAAENFSWEYWLGANVDEDETCKISSEEIICICLKKMTKYGYTNETAQEIYEEIHNAECKAKEAKSVKDEDIVKAAKEERHRIFWEKWNKTHLMLWLLKRFPRHSAVTYFFKRKEKEYSYVWSIADYMQPVILQTLKEYRQYHGWIKCHAEIPELANKEAICKTLNEMIFAFEHLNNYNYGDEDYDEDKYQIIWKRINNGIRLFGKLFQYL